MITEIEEYFAKGCGRCPRFATSDCATQHWAVGLRALREICLSTGLTETVKWGHPCYMHAGRNIAIISAFRADFRLSFFYAGLMKDPAGVLERQGPNTKFPDMIRFSDEARPGMLQKTIQTYLMESMGHAEAGFQLPKRAPVLDLPDELVAALDGDPELAEAFADLTPGRQKSYVIHLRTAKKPETRVARIAKFRGRILAGKGAMER